MTDTVAIALIAAIPGVAATLVGLLNNILAHGHTKDIAEVAKAGLRTDDNVAELARNTNSMKDELVKVTGQAEFAKGLKIGEGTTVGKPGATGAAGETGAAGAAGETGKQGEPGATGHEGKQGPIGMQGRTG